MATLKRLRKRRSEQALFQSPERPDVGDHDRHVAEGDPAELDFVQHGEAGPTAPPYPRRRTMELPVWTSPRLLREKRTDLQEVRRRRVEVEKKLALAVEPEGDHPDTAVGFGRDERDPEPLEAPFHVEKTRRVEPLDLGHAIGEPGGQGQGFEAVALFGELADVVQVGDEAAGPGGPPELAERLLEELDGRDGPAEVGDGRVLVVADAGDPAEAEMRVGGIGRARDDLGEDRFGLGDAARLEDGEAAHGHGRGVEGGVGQELGRELVRLPERRGADERGQGRGVASARRTGQRRVSRRPFPGKPGTSADKAGSGAVCSCWTS